MTIDHSRMIDTRVLENLTWFKEEYDKYCMRQWTFMIFTDNITMSQWHINYVTHSIS